MVAAELYFRMSERIAGLAFVAPALPASGGFEPLRRSTFGSLLRLLATRALLSNDTTGLRYVRRNILKRRDEVLEGKLWLLEGGNPGAASQDDASNEEEAGGLDSPAAQEVIEGYLKPLQADDWDRGTLLNLRSFSFPTGYDWSRVTVPTLVVAGRDDAPLVDGARALARELKERSTGSIEYVEMECGHSPMEERAEEFNQLLGGFIAKVLERYSESGERPG
jgi:pimeloyl-ACP methyl ester carboxylesterase